MYLNLCVTYAHIMAMPIHIRITRIRYDQLIFDYHHYDIILK